MNEMKENILNDNEWWMKNEINTLIPNNNERNNINMCAYEGIYMKKNTNMAPIDNNEMKIRKKKKMSYEENKGRMKGERNNERNVMKAYSHNIIINNLNVSEND